MHTVWKNRFASIIASIVHATGYFGALSSYMLRLPYLGTIASCHCNHCTCWALLRCLWDYRVLVEASCATITLQRLGPTQFFSQVLLRPLRHFRLCNGRARRSDGVPMQVSVSKNMSHQFSTVPYVWCYRGIAVPALHSTFKQQTQPWKKGGPFWGPGVIFGPLWTHLPHYYAPNLHFGLPDFALFGPRRHVTRSLFRTCL